MSNSWFQFKQFRIEQHRSALKVGTDGVLLGAWCEVNSSKRILDVGTGSGLIALMVAQRSEAEISAIEIDCGSCMDAELNFAKSTWNARLKLYKGDFNHLEDLSPGLFDLVVSNPPFFKQSLKSANPASAAARHDLSLSFLQLIKGSRKLLNENGRLAVILPMEAFDDFRECARLAGFYLSRKTTVIPKVGKPPKRVLLEFSVPAVYPIVDELIILNTDGEYTVHYKDLTKDFYLDLM